MKKIASKNFWFFEKQGLESATELLLMSQRYQFGSEIDLSMKYLKKYPKRGVITVRESPMVGTIRSLPERIFMLPRSVLNRKTIPLGLSFVIRLLYIMGSGMM
jgi:hypothetical protein